MSGNRLSPAEAERLACLAEEAGEIVQIVGKILRFGYESYSPQDELRITNRELLQFEIGDLLAIVSLMSDKNDIVKGKIDTARQKKTVRLQRYLLRQDQ